MGCRYQNTKVGTKIEKKIVNNNNVCIPLRIKGEDEIKYDESVDISLEFTKFEDIENHFNLKIDEIATKYCVIR